MKLKPQICRVWSKFHKTIIPFHLIRMEVASDGDGCGSCCLDKFLEDSELIFMWSIGRTDRAGIEIFDGDVLRVDRQQTNAEGASVLTTMLCRVEWYDKEFRFRLRRLGSSQKDVPELFTPGLIFKVKGNVYENERFFSHS